MVARVDRQYALKVPAIVQAAKRTAVDAGFDLRPGGNPIGGSPVGPSACLDEVGSLLRALATSMPQGRIGEVGTGAGVGTAWLAAGLSSTATLTSVELVPHLASAARSLFTQQQNVSVITGDWREVMPRHAPFDLLFFDGGGLEALREDNWSLIAGLMAPGGVLVLDDLTPEELWPESWRGVPDPKRELAFRSGLFVACEVRSRADAALLLLVRPPGVE